MALNTAAQNPNTSNVIPSSAQNIGIDRGSCSWFERPMGGNRMGDRLQIVDAEYSIYTWTGAEWSNPTVSSKTNPVTGGVEISAGGMGITSLLGINKPPVAGTVLVDWADAVIGAPTAGWTVEKTGAFGSKAALKVTATAGAADALSVNITIPATYFGGVKRFGCSIKPGDVAVSGDGINHVQLWVLVNGAYTKLKFFAHANLLNGDWTEGYVFDQDAANTAHVGSIVDWTATGLAGYECTTIRLVMTKKAGFAIDAPLLIGPMISDPIQKKEPTLTIFFDGNYSGQYSYARPILQAYGARASLATVTPWIGSQGMTEDKVTKMYAQGHELICHTGSPGNFGWNNTTKYPDGSEYELVKADILAHQEWQLSRGMVRGIGYGVVGFTTGLDLTQSVSRRANISAAVRDAGIKKLRQLGATEPYFGACGQSSTCLPGSRMALSTDTVPSLASVIDYAKARGGWSGLTFHDFALTGATGNNVNASILEGVLDYASTQGVTILPFSEAMERIAIQGNPV